MDKSFKENLHTATSNVQKIVQNIDLKRKFEDSSSQAPVKKAKIDTESSILKKLKGKLNSMREQKKQEKADKQVARPPWPPIFDHEGSPRVIVSSMPSTPHVVSAGSSPIKELNPNTLSLCPACPRKDVHIQQLTTQVEDSLNLLKIKEREIQELTGRMAQAEEYRRFLHGQLVEMKGPIKVMCRVKPIDRTAAVCLGFPEARLLDVPDPVFHTVTWSVGPHHSNYIFDRVFHMDARQEDVFEELKPYVQSALDGDHVCVFTYGQTGSGKTYTLEGPDFTGKVTDTSGVIPRAALYVFNELNRQELTADFMVSLSCMEIYNDSLYDLLCDSQEKLAIKTLNGKVSIEPLTLCPVSTSEALLHWIATAVQRRATRETHLNTASSRSHCIYQLLFEGRNLAGKTTSGKLNIIDLAGSERANAEGYDGKSQKEVQDMKVIQNEAKFINTSLSCLRRVVSSLISNRTRGSGLLPPYRESKLTRILQDSLSHSDAKLLLMVNVCAGQENASETHESLKFGADAQFCLT